MPTREEVRRLLAAGMDYEQAGHSLGVSAGQAHLIATGLAADGEGLRTAREQGSGRPLVGPPEVFPTGKDSVRDWLRSRVAADEQMRQAARGRRIDPGGARDPGTEGDITTVLTREHNRVTAMAKQLKSMPGRGAGASPEELAHRAAIVDAIASVVTPHIEAEKRHLWPSVREVLEGGDALADQALEQYARSEETLAALARSAPDGEQYERLADELPGQLRKHVAFTDTVFAALCAATSQETRDMLGERIRRDGDTQPAG